MAATFTPASIRSTTPRDRTIATWRNLSLWTLQGWIAMFVIAAGYAKITESMDNLILLMNWPALVSESFVRGVGIAEVVLAIGVLAPLASWTFGRPILIVATAGLIALETIMLGVHALGGDISLAIVNVFLLAITVPVLIGRRAR